MAGEQMWVALLQDITFLLPSSPPKRYQPALKKCPPLPLTPVQCPIVTAQTLSFWSQTPELAHNQAEPLLNFVPSAAIQELESLDDTISPHPPASACPHSGSAALSLPGG